MLGSVYWLPAAFTMCFKSCFVLQVSMASMVPQCLQPVRCPTDSEEAERWLYVPGDKKQAAVGHLKTFTMSSCHTGRLGLSDLLFLLTSN